MLIHQIARLAVDDRQDLSLHELLVPDIQLRARVARQRLELKIEEFVDIQRAGLVLIVKCLIARLVHFTVKHAALDQELRPLEIAVAGKQRVVQIEKHQFQVLCSALKIE